MKKLAELPLLPPGHWQPDVIAAYNRVNNCILRSTQLLSCEESEVLRLKVVRDDLKANAPLINAIELVGVPVIWVDDIRGKVSEVLEALEQAITQRNVQQVLSSYFKL